MLRYRRASRVELSKVSGISQPTVTRIVDQLLAAGILVESHTSLTGMESTWSQPVGALGRPSKPLELDSSQARFIAIQIGVHQTRITPAPLAVSAQDQWTHSFDTPGSLGEWEQRLQGIWSKLPARGISAVVASLPGVVDELAGRVLFSPNLKWSQGADLAAIIRKLSPAPLICIQEIRALALGQAAVEPESSDFLLVDFGTGVGAAAVTQGSLYSGPLPLSGELGHTPVPNNARPCGCGSTGCVETLVSRKGLLQSAAEHHDASTWAELVTLIEQRGLPDWMKRSLDAAAISIASALNMLGIRQVILTGCISELPNVAADYLATAMRADTLWARFGEVGCKVAPRHRLVGMVIRAIERTLLTAE
ncbi:MAG: ROK family transcriptional regulator [Burkholderiales bacterium]|nr:ROK family transcriptional regulator [Phycisphaerae bacterium]